MLNTVRTPISRRAFPTKRILLWNDCAKRNEIPTFCMQAEACAGESDIFTPSDSRTSAAPLLLETLRLPCFATLRPVPAITNEEVVEILNEPARSPPVPTISTADFEVGTMEAFLRIMRAKPVISSVVSPFARRNARKPAICASVAPPDIMISIASSASAGVRSLPSETILMYFIRALRSESGRGTATFSKPLIPAISERKFDIILLPRSVRTDSGWN